MGLGYLNALDKVEPGVTRNRGKTLFEIAEVQLTLLHSSPEKQEQGTVVNIAKGN